MKKYSEGPWILNESSDIEIWANGELVCSLPIWDPDNTGYNVCDVTAADANLIAAAPDMLEALEMMVDMMDCGDEHGEGGQWYKKARAAITKAKGESK